MFTTQHYNAFADLLAKERVNIRRFAGTRPGATGTYDRIEDAIIRLFSADNPRFKADYFRDVVSHKAGE